MTMEFVMLAISTWPEDLKCGLVIGSPEWINHCGGNTMGTLQEQALAGTMREEFEAWWQQEGNGTYRRSDMFVRDEDCPDEYLYSDVQHGWRLHQAAYAAGQRSARLEEREACAMTVGMEAVDAEATGTESDYAYNRAIEHAAAAIRNRKEQG